MMMMMMMMMMMIFSGYLLGLVTSCAAPRGSWVLNFHHPAGNSRLDSISRLLRHAGKHSGSILLTPKPHVGGGVIQIGRVHEPAAVKPQ